MSGDNYRVKYLKYKQKYNELKQIQEGGANNTYGIGFAVLSHNDGIILTSKPRSLLADSNNKNALLSNIKKELPKFKLTNLNTLKNINMNDILGGRDPSQPTSTNTIKNMNFLMGSDNELNTKIISEIKMNTKVNTGDYIIIMILAMPSLIYTDINSGLNGSLNMLSVEV